VLANVLSGCVSVYSPAAVRTRNERRLVSISIPEVLSDRLTTGHN
jgi:hypothetical protein